jgi:hypothetical protein
MLKMGDSVVVTQSQVAVSALHVDSSLFGAQTSEQSSLLGRHLLVNRLPTSHLHGDKAASFVCIPVLSVLGSVALGSAVVHMHFSEALWQASLVAFLLSLFHFWVAAAFVEMSPALMSGILCAMH